jgi:hypothetical protein
VYWELNFGDTKMPVVPTTGVVYLSDLAPEVIAKLENRTSDLSRASKWLADTLLELTCDPQLRNDFDELEAWGNTWNLVVGQQEYPFSNFLNPNLEYNQATLDVLLWTDPPQNVVRIKLNPTHYQDADRSTVNQTPVTGSQPGEWYRFADMIGFNPVPGQAYQVQARCLRMHPIASPDPGGTQLLLSREWHEVLEWGAAERGFMELQEFDKAQAIHQILHGDPKHPDRPGIWGAKYTRRQKENYRTTMALRPVIRAYGYGGGRY